MSEDRITSEITIGYKTINSRGIATIEIPLTKVIIRDQSPAAASAHLLSILAGLAGPAKEQIGGK